MSRYVVRIVLPDGVHDLTPEVRSLLNLQAHAGLVTVHRDDEDGVCFDLLPPAGAPATWADETVWTFVGEHYNAVRAPECPQ